MPIWTYTHNGFHGRHTIRIQVPYTSAPGVQICLTDNQARRLRKLCCGIPGCTCGENGGSKAIDYARHVLTLPEQGAEIQGNYPQEA